MDDVQFFERLQNRNKLIQKDKEGNDILEKLNVLIRSDKQTQRYAICILNSVVKNCNHEVFEENATTWMRFVLQTIHTIPSDNLLNLCFVTLTRLLEYASDVHKVARDVATKGIDPLLVLLVGTSLPMSSEKFNMIRCCVLNFSGPCGQHRSAILKLVVSAIESDEYHNCLAAYKMFALLPICGSAGEKKNKFLDNWVNQFYQVVNTTHFYISKLINKVSNIDDTSSNKKDNSKLIPFSEITEKLEIDTVKISSRIESLLLMLQNLIATTMCFEIQFPVLKLINLFCETSNLLHVELKDVEGYDLVVIKINEALLKCICVSIKQFKTLLIPFLQQIMSILTSAISSKRIANKTYVYQCIIKLIDHWKVLPTNLNVVDNIFVNIFSDIKILDDLSHLSNERTNDSNTQNKNNNHTHTLTHDIYEQSKKERNRFNSTACKNAYSALNVLEKVLYLNGPVLSVRNLNSIITNILNIFVKFYGKEGFLVPYCYDDNRLMIFKVAKRLLSLYHGSVQIPVSILLSFFNAGTTELHDGIRCYCQDVLLEYDCIIHPLSLGFHDNKYVQRDSNLDYSTQLDDDVKNIKTEEICYPKTTELDVPLNNINEIATIESTDQPTRLCYSADHILAKGSTSILPPCESSFTKQPMRLCSSADQVLAKEAVSIMLPTRASSEPVIHQSAMVRLNYNSSATVQYNAPNGIYIPSLNQSNENGTDENGTDENGTDENYYDEDPKLEEEEYDDSPVVISDNSSEEDVTSYVPPQFQAAPLPPSGNGSMNINPPHHDRLDNMYSPRSKKAKLNDGDYEDDGDNNEYDGDKEYVDILDTFCELDADD